MSTAYTWQIIIIVPLASQTTANGYAEALTNNPADANTFQSNCSPSGQVPATACIIGPTPILPTDAANLVTNMAPNIPGGRFYITDASSQILLQTNSDTAQASIGLPWSAAQAMLDQSLALITQAQ